MAKAELRKPAPGRAVAPALPKSVTRGWIVGLGLLAWIGSLWTIHYLKLNQAGLAHSNAFAAFLLQVNHSLNLFDPIHAAVFCMAVAAVVNFTLDITVQRIHAAPSTGLNWTAWHPSAARVLIKCLGLLATLGFVALLYWLFPEYHGDFYNDYWALLRRYLPWWLALSIPYILLVDARQEDPRDGYYAAGLAVTFQFRKVNPSLLWQHCLGWIVKAFFVPLMFSYHVRDVRAFLGFDFSSIRNFGDFYDFGYFYIFLADAALACAGYLLTYRLFDTHIRQTEPTFKGWVVAVGCYEPFWSFVFRQYLFYQTDYPWGTWLRDGPVQYTIWGSVILALLAIYFWSTVMFGCRFSNLTHRGILTNGPYRWTRHPAYISKMLAYWLISIPFIFAPNKGPSDSFRRCLLMGLLSFIYYLRAKTEEANLGVDPTYVQYSEWVKRNGLFGRLKRLIAGVWS